MSSYVPLDYRSAAEYCFDEEQADDIILFAGHRRRDFPRGVIWFPPSQHVPVRTSIARPFNRHAGGGVGMLDWLPLEILWHVVLCLDIHSVFRLRQTNTGARQIVDGLREYQMAASHGLNCLRALLRTRLAATVSLLDFHKALCTETCALCGDFSGIVSLPTWTRCCFQCLWAAPEIQIRRLGRVRELFDFSEYQLASLHPFKTLGGICTRDEPPRRPRTAISLHQATLLSGQQEEDCSAYDDDWQGRKYNFLGACELPYYNKRTGEAEHRGIFCAGCEVAFWGRAKAGGAPMWARQAHDKVFSKVAFLEHFKWCKEAQRLWMLSGEGCQTPAELKEEFMYLTPRNEDRGMDGRGEEQMYSNKYSCRFAATLYAGDRSSPFLTLGSPEAEGGVTELATEPRTTFEPPSLSHSMQRL